MAGFDDRASHENGISDAPRRTVETALSQALHLLYPPTPIYPIRRMPSVTVCEFGNNWPASKYDYAISEGVDFKPLAPNSAILLDGLILLYSV